MTYTLIKLFYEEKKGDKDFFFESLKRRQKIVTNTLIAVKFKVIQQLNYSMKEKMEIKNIFFESLKCRQKIVTTTLITVEFKVGVQLGTSSVEIYIAIKIFCEEKE